VHKKSQENFERITMRRKITIMDGHPDTVSIWLAFLRKHQYYGVGMRADVYEQSSLDVAKDLDKEAQRIENLMGKLEIGGMGRKLDDNAAERLLVEEPYKAAWGAYAPSGGAQGVPHANKRIDRVKVVSNPAPQR
jgi:small subunit ribosomal protein S10